MDKRKQTFGSQAFETPSPDDDCNTCDLLKAALPGAGSTKPRTSDLLSAASKRTQKVASDKASNKPGEQHTQSSPSTQDTEGWEMEPPPGLTEIGNAGWTTLHTMAAYYPEKPSNEVKENARRLLEAFTHLFPCRDCANDLREWMAEHPPRVESRHEFSQWMCETHNHVNRRLGKPEFDCNLVEQRWSRLFHHKNTTPNKQ